MAESRVANLSIRTKGFALDVIELYSTLQRSTLHHVLGRQLLRSATSVGAHYREATRAKSVPDFVSKIEGALQELSETQYWLELLEAAHLTDEPIAALHQESRELTAMLVASARTAKQRMRRSRIRSAAA